MDDRVLYLDDEEDVRLAHRVSRFLVEVNRRHIGRRAQYKRSMVLCRPDVAETLDLQSDAFAPVVRPHGNGMDLRYVPPDKLYGVVTADGFAALGYMLGWTDEGAAYNAVLGPCPYEARPEETVVVPDFLCLDLIDNRFEPEPWFLPHGLALYPAADSILGGDVMG